MAGLESGVGLPGMQRI